MLRLHTEKLVTLQPFQPFSRSLSGSPFELLSYILLAIAKDTLELWSQNPTQQNVGSVTFVIHCKQVAIPSNMRDTLMAKTHSTSPELSLSLASDTSWGMSLKLHSYRWLLHIHSPTTKHPFCCSLGHIHNSLELPFTRKRRQPKMQSTGFKRRRNPSKVVTIYYLQMTPWHWFIQQYPTSDCRFQPTASFDSFKVKAPQ